MTQREHHINAETLTMVRDKSVTLHIRNRMKEMHHADIDADKNYNRNLQAMRFIFCMLIVFSHLAGFDFGGECGVAFFFITSGFVCSMSYSKRPEKDTNPLALPARQLKKFYPIYIITLIPFLAIGILSTHSVNMRLLAANLLLIQSWIPDPAYHFGMNGTSWFLSSLLFCYLSFPLLYPAGMKSGKKQLIAIMSCILAVYCSFAHLVTEQYLLYVFPPARLIDFFIGILCFRIFQKYGKYITSGHYDVSSAKVSAMQMTAVALVAASIPIYYIAPLWIKASAMFWLFLPPAMMMLIFTDNQDGILTKLLHSKAIQIGGEISLEIFLMQLPVIVVLKNVIIRAGLDPESIVSYLLITIILLILSYILHKLMQYLRHHQSADNI